MPKQMRERLARFFVLSARMRDGGPGSGNFNHEGRPGQVGGSGEGGGSSEESKGGLTAKHCGFDGYKPFNDALHEHAPEAFGDEEGITEAVRDVWRARFGTAKWLHDNGDDAIEELSYPPSLFEYAPHATV